MPKVVSTLAKSIDRRWARDLFVRHANLVIANASLLSGVPTKLRKDVLFFSKIASAFSDVSKLTNASLIDLIGPAFHLRQKRVVDSLISLEALPVLSREERLALELNHRVVGIFSKCSKSWIRKLIEGFYRRLLEQRDIYISRGYKRAIVSLNGGSICYTIGLALGFLEFASEQGASSATSITQHHLDLFLSKRKRTTANSYRSFIKYLNGRTPRFSKLAIPSFRSSPVNFKLILRADKFDSTLKTMMRPRNQRDLCLSLVCVICLVYAQLPVRAVSLTCDHVRLLSGRFQFKPASVWLDVPKPLQPLFSQWWTRLQFLKKGRAGPDYLFPGKCQGQHLGTAALYAWLIERRLRPSQLFPSAMQNLVRLGVTEAAVLSKAYGVPIQTANIYLKSLLPISEDRGSTLIPKEKSHVKAG